MLTIHEFHAEEAADYRRQYTKHGPETLLELTPAAGDYLADVVTQFYRDHLEQAGKDGYVVGLSGGVDSATVAHLLVEAVGADNVYGVVMPASHSADRDVEDALQVAAELGVPTNDPDRFRDRIDGVVEWLEALGEQVEPEMQRVKRGNILARCRMIVLRDIAKAGNRLVAGTTNASERDMGYMTLAADGRGGVDNEGLYSVYKTTLRQAARQFGVPDRIVDKQPSADLWRGQTDAEELGFTYDELDPVLVGLFLGFKPGVVAAETGMAEEDVQTVAERVAAMQFKREPAPHPSF